MLPYVNLWEAEKAKREEMKDRPLSLDEQRHVQLAEIDAQLDEIDRKSLRSLRAIAAGVAGDADKQQLDVLEEEAAKLREQRANMFNAAFD